ncbi:MAG: transglycosylase domain-containing protein [Actinomycetes bacterium]
MPATPPGRRKFRIVDVQTFLLVSVLAGAIVAAMCLPVVGSVAFATKEASATFDSLPAQLKSLPLPQRSYMVAADGSRIATLYAENRIVVPLEQISPLLQKGLIDTEDVRFYQHRGVDVKAAVRALVANSSAGDVQQGSSTITMQYVRNLLITNATTKEEIAAARVQTLGRKLQEMKYALAIEKQLTKAQILGGYLNVAYFGAGAYGAEAAARRYFNVSAADLTLSQAATLAGIVQQPVAFDPTKHPDAAQTRRNIVLERMVAAGDITAAQAEIAKATSVKKSLNPREQPNGCTAGPYPFFCEFVLNQIKNDPRYGATQAARTDLIKRGAFTIQTTLDPKKQDIAQTTVDKYIPQTDRSRKAAAVAMVEPGTGKVLALAENRTWGTSGAGKTAYNYAVNAADGGTIGMQAGSTFKIFTIAAAFEKGLNPNDWIDSPQTKTFGGGDWGCGSERFKAYTVNNSTGAGTFNMWQGAALSVNTYFMELERQAGLCRTVDIAERMGVTLANGKPLLRYPSFTLGTMEVSPLAVAGAYATMANHGVYCRSHAIVSITNFAGKPQYTDDGSCRQAVSREVADATTAVLSGVIDGNIGGRTGQTMTIGRDAAGKTGTTDSNAAVWFAGYTPELSTAVWVGDPRGGFEHPLQNVTINGQYYDLVHGGSLPGPIWRDVMLGALEGTPPRDFDLKASFNLTQARKGGVGQTGGSSSWDSTYGQQMQPDPQYNPYYYYKPQTKPTKRP